MTKGFLEKRSGKLARKAFRNLGWDLAKPFRCSHNYSMPNSNEIAKLNQLLSDIKVLVGSLSILDKATESKDQVVSATALDALNFRVREISKTYIALALNDATKDSTNITSSKKFSTLQIEDILIELSKPTPNLKKLHDLMDAQLESLRKIALSEILTLSIE